MTTHLQDRRRLAAIMFTDMVGYSALTQKNEQLALQLLDEHQRILRPIFPRHGGREIETAGDSFFVEFDSALQAVQCAVEIQTTLTATNSTRPVDRKILLRIGLHLGDVVFMGDKVHGDGVNIAARVEPLAKPGGICVTEDIAHQIQNKIEVPVLKLGRSELKNIKLPIDVYQVVMPWENSGHHWHDRLRFLFRQKRIRVSVALYLVSGILEAAILFFFIRIIFGPSAPGLSVASDPPGSPVFFNGHSVGNTPINLPELQAGTFPLRIDRDGYASRDTTLTLTAGQHLSLSFSLIKLPSHNALNATQKPPDDRAAPLHTDIIASRLPQNTRHASDADPRGAVESMPGKLASHQPGGTLILQVIPDGSISVDGSLEPVDPNHALTLEVAAGDHTIRFENSHFGAKELTVSLKEKETLKRTCYFQSYVSITALPVWAMIVIDGKNTETPTPKDRYPLSPGTHHITVERTGYATLEREKELNVIPSLEEQLFRLTFHLDKK